MLKTEKLLNPKCPTNKFIDSNGVVRIVPDLMAAAVLISDLDDIGDMFDYLPGIPAMDAFLFNWLANAPWGKQAKASGSCVYNLWHLKGQHPGGFGSFGYKDIGSMDLNKIRQDPDAMERLSNILDIWAFKAMKEYNKVIGKQKLVAVEMELDNNASALHLFPKKESSWGEFYDNKAQEVGQALAAHYRVKGEGARVEVMPDTTRPISGRNRHFNVFLVTDTAAKKICSFEFKEIGTDTPFGDYTKHAATQEN